MGWSTVAAIGTQAVSSAAQWYGSHREAKMQREWQERMYKNRHQWEVQDLKAAGLNPVLSAQYGGGSVPSGATAQLQAPNLANTASRASEVSRENQVRAANKALLEEQTNTARAQRELIVNQARQADANTRIELAKNYPSLLKLEEIHKSPVLQQMIQKEAWSDSLGRYTNSASSLSGILKNVLRR